MERLVISDGIDTATLVPTGDHWTLTIDVQPSDTERRQRLMEASAQALSADGGGRIVFWVTDVDDAADHVSAAAGFMPFRDLWKLGRPLPALPGTLTTRPFMKEDSSAFLNVNNRAFEWHPEQGGMTEADLALRQEKSWYDANGFRIWEDGGKLAGFCWTKVHNDVDPPVGEIYAIAIDSDIRGRGFGRELTLAGLDWLAGLGLRRAILYVESDNHPANHIYKELGFEREATNRAYQRVLR